MAMRRKSRVDRTEVRHVVFATESVLVALSRKAPRMPETASWSQKTVWKGQRWAAVK
jgi:hypothetical protein